METSKFVGCPLHGNGVDPVRLVGRTVERVVESRHVYDGVADGPVDVWLVDDRGAWTHITAGSDRCLITEPSGPFEGCDMGEYGRMEVRQIRSGTPLADHVGEKVVRVRQKFGSRTGRMGLDLVFASGTVHFDSGTGDLHMTE